MRRFRFSLETVLKVRRGAEDAAKRALALAQADRDRALMALGAVEADTRSLLVEQGAARERRVELHEELWFQARLGGLEQAAAAARKRLEEKEKALEERRTKAVEAARERLVLERLEEKQRLEHQAQANREEQGLLDDLAQRSVSALAFPR